MGSPAPFVEPMTEPRIYQSDGGSCAGGRTIWTTYENRDGSFFTRYILESPYKIVATSAMNPGLVVVCGMRAKSPQITIKQKEGVT